MKTVILLGVPMDAGQRRPGCLMGPAAYRVAGIAQAIADQGHAVQDRGDLAPGPVRPASCANAAVDQLPAVLAWTQTIAAAGRAALTEGLPVFMGGDHALSLGSVAGVAAHAAAAGRPLFVLWLDAHSDVHTPLTTTSGNLHGTPLLNTGILLVGYVFNLVL